MPFLSFPKHPAALRHPRSHRRTRRFQWILAISLLALSAWILHRLQQWNQRFVSKELEAPFDHIRSTLLKPVYSYSCPSSADVQQSPICTLPKIIMVSARPSEQVKPVVESWTKEGFAVEVVSTTNLSAHYVNQRCQKESWKSRLFGIYHAVIAQVLQQDASLQYLVTLEDDVVLQDGRLFRQELCYALQQQVGFYSFHRTQTTSCIYQWGTQAQVWSRDMLERTLRVDHDTYCRLPIDMYVAQQGPWYATQQDLVRHVGKRFVP